jgi:hypothetical protein
MRKNAQHANLPPCSRATTANQERAYLERTDVEREVINHSNLRHPHVSEPRRRRPAASATACAPGSSSCA